MRSLLDCMVYVLLVGSFYLSATANAKTNLFVRVCMTAHYATSGLMAKPIWTKNALRADVAHRKRGSVTLPRVADYTLMWIAGSWGVSCS